MATRRKPQAPEWAIEHALKIDVSASGDRVGVRAGARTEVSEWISLDGRSPGYWMIRCGSVLFRLTAEGVASES